MQLEDDIYNDFDFNNWHGINNEKVINFVSNESKIEEWWLLLREKFLNGIDLDWY